MKKGICFLLLINLLAGCLAKKQAAGSQQSFSPADTLTLFDTSRGRKIPVAVYKPAAKHPQLVIFSHGYGMNRGDSYLAYSYLTGYLAAKGYFVVSIQHELPTDSLIPSTGVVQVVRRPFWERGVENIMFVINEYKKINPGLDYKHITLIGHSNGADMTALFVQKYPGVAGKIITLDNRRVPLPRTAHPRVYSLRSSDQPADEGVLPDRAEQKKYGMMIIGLPDTRHSDMDDHANNRQRDEIRKYIMDFLND